MVTIETTIGGELAWCGRHRTTSLYTVDPWGLNHDADLRIGGEAPRRRAHSPTRYDDQCLVRVATTSDRYRQIAAVKPWLPNLS